jgi:hypothetical protein
MWLNTGAMKHAPMDGDVMLLFVVFDATAAPGSMSRRGRGGIDDDDEDDDDPMARFGPMPEAGAFAAGPIEDEGEDGQGEGEAAAAAAGQPSSMAAAAHAAAAYYVGAEAAAAQQQYYYDQHSQYAGRYTGGAEGGSADPGQALFEQALLEEQGRAAKKGKVSQPAGKQSVLLSPSPTCHSRA